MEWKIDYIILKNFKFFKDKFTLDLQRNNLLVYGENGSGKSSIHWGFHTMLQSCLKTKDETDKYFDPSNEENLINCFAAQNEDSYIKLSFSDGQGETKEFVLSKDRNMETNNPFLIATVTASDFLNYRYLSSLFDFRNSMDNDIFTSLEKEVLPYLYFKTNKKLVYPNKPNKNALKLSECWECIKEWQNYLKCNQISTDEEQTYKGICTIFDTELNEKFDKIQIGANEKLSDVFNIPVSLSFKYEGISNHLENYDYCPKLIIKAQLEYETIHPATQEICHLRTFFNEAKLCCIALAIRLTIVDMRLSFPNHILDYSKLLFIDDLLLSLDMSNRRLVIRILLDYSSQYQMILFTHDRAFYYLIQDEILLRDEQNKWKYYEFYQPDDDKDIDEMPKPCMKENSLSYIRALKLFEIHQYPAAALEIRKGFEKLFCNLYPKNWTKSINFQENNIQNLPFAQLIKKWKDFCGRFDCPENILDVVTIDRYRDTLLNPLAHNNIMCPIYRQEIKDCIKILKSSEEKIKLKTIAGNNDILREQFTITLYSSRYHHISVDFYFKEVFRRLEFDRQRYYENAKVKVIRCDTMHVVNSEHSCLLKTLLERINKKLDTVETFSFSKIGEYVTNSSHVKLDNI